MSPEFNKLWPTNGCNYIAFFTLHIYNFLHDAQGGCQTAFATARGACLGPQIFVLFVLVLYPTCCTSENFIASCKSRKVDTFG